MPSTILYYKTEAGTSGVACFVAFVERDCLIWGILSLARVMGCST